jgi:Notch-like protein
MWRVLLLATVVAAYPSGAPEASCGNQLPSHGASLTSGTGGYTLTFPFATSYTLSEPAPAAATTIRVDVGGSVNGGVFQAIIMSVFDATNTRVGQFTSVPSGFQRVCSLKGVTHSNGATKTPTSFTWVVPSSGVVSPIYFKATVMRDFTTYFKIEASLAELTEPESNSTCTPSDICFNGGTCTTTDPELTCDCVSERYTDSDCSVDQCLTLGCYNTSACASSPCMNGGTCGQTDTDDFVCACSSNYTGTYCDQEVGLSICSFSPCENGGTCGAIGLTDYACACDNGYAGVHCEDTYTNETITVTETVEICTKPPISLTKGELAGIVIGSVVGGVVLATMFTAQVAVTPVYQPVPRS